MTKWHGPGTRRCWCRSPSTRAPPCTPCCTKSVSVHTYSCEEAPRRHQRSVGWGGLQAEPSTHEAAVDTQIWSPRSDR